MLPALDFWEACCIFKSLSNSPSLKHDFYPSLGCIVFSYLDHAVECSLLTKFWLAVARDSLLMFTLSPYRIALFLFRNSFTPRRKLRKDRMHSSVILICTLFTGIYVYLILSHKGFGFNFSSKFIFLLKFGFQVFISCSRIW